MIRITFEAKNYVSLCEELKLFLSYSNIPTTEEPPTAPVAPATAPPVAPVAQPTPVAPVAPVTQPTTVAPVVPTSVSVPTTPEPQQAPTTPAVPVAPVKEYTLEEIQVALIPIMDAGRTNEIVGLMQKYGVSDLTKVPKDSYHQLIQDIRNMGARI